MAGLRRRLASTGNWGRRSGNVQKQLTRAIRSAGLLSCSAQSYHASFDTVGDVELFLPHEVYHYIVKDVGLENVTMPEDQLNAVSGPGPLLKRWALHPDVQVPEECLKDVGIVGIHCDGVPYTTTVRAGCSKSIFVCSLNVFSGQSPAVLRRRQPLFTIQKSRLCGCGCSGHHTIQELFAVIAWSLQHLAKGTVPECRHDGSPWTPHDLVSRLAFYGKLRRAALLQVRGDWDFLKLLFAFVVQVPTNSVGSAMQRSPKARVARGISSRQHRTGRH